MEIIKTLKVLGNMILGLGLSALSYQVGGWIAAAIVLGLYLKVMTKC